jgi:hypothetical protein
MQPTHLNANIRCVWLIYYYYSSCTLLLRVGQSTVVTEGIAFRKLCNWPMELIPLFPTLYWILYYLLELNISYSSHVRKKGNDYEKTRQCSLHATTLHPNPLYTFPSNIWTITYKSPWMLECWLHNTVVTWNMAAMLYSMPRRIKSSCPVTNAALSQCSSSSRSSNRHTLRTSVY